MIVTLSLGSNSASSIALKDTVAVVSLAANVIKRIDGKPEFGGATKALPKVVCT